MLVRNAGAVWALEDRCPHRGVPLSAGCLTANGLACPYHGWTFDGDGVCREMPGWPDATPADVRIAAFDVIESDGLIWVSARSPLPSSRVFPARIACLGLSRRLSMTQTVWRLNVVDAQARVLEALVPAGRPDQRATVTVTGDGFVIGDNTGRGTHAERVIERVWFSGLSVVQLERRYAHGTTVRITLGFTPCDDQSTRVFSMAHAEGRRAPRWLERWSGWRLMRRVPAPGRQAPPRSDLARRDLQAAWMQATREP